MHRIGKVVITVFAAAMAFQTVAMAAPLDELNEILTKQAELQQASLLSETLGLPELGTAIKENGIDFGLKGALSEGTEATLGMEGEIPQDAYVELGLQADLKEKEWILDAGFGAEGASLGDLTLYGSSDKLSLSVPQLFVGAVSLYAGNLKEQYAGSALEMMLGEGTSEQLPELNMRFYPEASDLEALASLGGGFEAALLQELEGVEEQIQVEKTEEAEGIVYVMTMPTEVIKDVYSVMFEQYLSLIRQSGMVEVTQIYELEDELELMIDQMFAIMPENLDMNFYTEDGLLKKITYELYMDTSTMAALEQIEGDISYNTQSADEETVYTEELSGEVEEAGTVSSDVAAEEDGAVSEEIMEADVFKGTISYEIIYNDPSNPADSMDINMVMTEETTGETASVQMQLRTAVEGSVEEKTVALDVTAMEESAYSGTIYTQTFNAETGDFDVKIGFEGKLPESIEINLDSTFTGIEAGRAFTWKLDGLTLEIEGEAIGVTGEVSVSADPGEIAAPAQERVLLDLTEEELMGLMMEVTQNAQVWAAQFNPETEGLYDSGEYELEEEAYEETVVGEEADAVSVIGGADGPTSIYLAGKAS